LQTLLERKLVAIMGRKPVVGRPILYGTSREFLIHFGLNTLSDLPTLEEFAQMAGEQL
jgi:segregation and condensation protein B